MQPQEKKLTNSKPQGIDEMTKYETEKSRDNTAHRWVMRAHIKDKRMRRQKTLKKMDGL